MLTSSITGSCCYDSLWGTCRSTLAPSGNCQPVTRPKISILLQKYFDLVNSIQSLGNHQSSHTTFGNHKLHNSYMFSKTSLMFPPLRSLRSFPSVSSSAIRVVNWFLLGTPTALWPYSHLNIYQKRIANLSLSLLSFPSNSELWEGSTVLAHLNMNKVVC